MPKVTVVIPTYNSQKTIKRAIQSILKQTFSDFEIIVVDDASKDKTVEILKEYQKRDERIKIFVLKENSGGPALPRNMGIQNSSGEYIALLDNDDMYLPKNLEIKSKILDENPKIDMVIGYSWAVEEKTKRIIDYLSPYTLSWMVRKEVFEKIGYFKQEQSGADEIGWALRYQKLKGDSNGIFILKEPLTLYFWSSGQMSKKLREENPAQLAKRWESLLEEIRNSNFFRETQSHILSRLGNLYCLAGDLRKGQRAFNQSLKLKFNLYSLVLFIVSLFGKRNYKKLEKILRSFYRCFIWRERKILAQIKYKKSYKEAVEILSNL